MAAGDRNKYGKAIDIVSHYVTSFIPAVSPICGQKKFWHSTTVRSDVTCKKCLKALNESPKSPFPHWAGTELKIQN